MDVMKRILILAQKTGPYYIGQLKKALGECEIDLVSGSRIEGEGINWIKAPEHDPRSLKSRLLCWLRYMMFVKSWSAKQKDGYDLIYAVSNPPINGYIGLKLKKRFKAPFIYMNWDLYPQIIEKSIKSSVTRIPCRAWRKWNTIHYPKIDAILTIGQQMAKSIETATLSKINLKVIPFATNTTSLKPVDKRDNRFLLENGLADKFVVLFSGKMGIGHNLELVLEAASKLKDKKDIAFVFIGEGPKYRVIEKYIEDNSPENVHLFPWQDSDMYPYSIACGDVAVVTEEKSAEGLMLPSRVFNMMACGEAIIGICGKNDDLYGLITDNGIGECVIDDNADKLVSIIERMHSDKEILMSMQKKSRRVIDEQYSSDTIVEKYKVLFEEYL